MNLESLCQVKDFMATVVQLEGSLRKETGLNLNQAFVLCCLAQSSHSAGALAEELRIHGASLSRILKTLYSKGYIHRDVSGDDSRQRFFSLTATGRQVASTLAVCEQRLFPVFVEERGLAKTH